MLWKILPLSISLLIDILGDDLPETAKKKVKMKLAYQASVSKQEPHVYCMIIQCLVACVINGVLQVTRDVCVCIRTRVQWTRIGRCADLGRHYGGDPWRTERIPTTKPPTARASSAVEQDQLT